VNLKEFLKEIGTWTGTVSHITYTVLAGT